MRLESAYVAKTIYYIRRQVSSLGVVIRSAVWPVVVAVAFRTAWSALNGLAVDINYEEEEEEARIIRICGFY